MKRSSLEWHKSTYSDASGGNCLEMATWRKSTYSGASGGDCLEVADGLPDIVPVRDSKSPELPGVVFPAAAWSAFVTSLKTGTATAV
ncbi:DUF397 domain-containing protein [Streptomyces sp. NBC_01716]|uniref:DUF397 domain-containing protein n=1 Tax=Streptomyces sp. NBC_01716 TaxID=2975917 RepID=UPI002E37D98F|nr:DUF397 domain-containing protein [Streptomyces sp. NBC_01716]